MADDYKKFNAAADFGKRSPMKPMASHRAMDVRSFKNAPPAKSPVSSRPAAGKFTVTRTPLSKGRR